MDSPSTSSYSALNLPHWIARIYLDDEYEEAENNANRLELMDRDARQFIWGLTVKLLGMQPTKGLAGQACQIFERYVAVYVTRICEHVALDSPEWHRKKWELRNRMLLLVAVSIQLAAKMSSGHLLNTHLLKETLQKDGIIFTLQEINSAEAEVFAAIDYRIPSWTNVDKAEMFSIELGMPIHFLEIVVLVMEIANYNCKLLHERVKRIALDTSPPCRACQRSITGIREMHIVAGVVSATARLLFYPPGITQVLSVWTRSHLGFIKTISDVIVDEVICLAELNDEPTGWRLIQPNMFLY